MYERFFDNALTRWVGSRLEADHNAGLGIERTMRLARRFNRLKNRRFRRYRAMQYRKLDALYRENGGPQTASRKLEDGWAIDTSRSLPGLDRLLADADEIIRARAGVNRGGGDRAFFQQILDDACIDRYPSLLDFAASSDVLQSVIDYLGLIPTLSGNLPLGVRLNESWAGFVEDSDGVYKQSQLFHRDYHDAPMVYVIVTLKDVAMNNGPFCFLPGAVSQEATRGLHYGAKGTSYRITDDRMYGVVSPDRLHKLCYPAGTVLFIDSHRCFHYGSRDAMDPRYLMMYAYVSVCRTDFTDMLRTESRRPVPESDTRVKRRVYPIREEDSTLKRMIVRRDYLGPDA